jgi:amino acid permease
LADTFDGGFGRLVGFWQCCCQATFSYLGVEMIGIAANETKNPRDHLPPAVRGVSYHIFFYYVGAIFVLGLNVSVVDPILKYRIENSS